LITSIIFSKNRPLQLDLCLKSIKKNFPQSTENIVIHNNSVNFSNAHKQLKKEHSDVDFWQQTDSIFCDLWDGVNEAKNNHICFFVDDCICYNEISLPDELLSFSQVGCFSLRLGANTTQRWHYNVCYADEPRDYGIEENGMHMVWNKTAHCYGSYWSYSHSVDGHIFRKSDISEMAFELWKISKFKKMKQTPNEIESALQRFWALSPPLMCCPLESKVVNSPNNKVQESHDNRSGDYFDYNEKTLLEKYESGSRIDLEDLDFSDIKCPHTEIDILKGLK